MISEKGVSPPLNCRTQFLKTEDLSPSCIITVQSSIIQFLIFLRKVTYSRAETFSYALVKFKSGTLDFFSTECFNEYIRKKADKKHFLLKLTIPTNPNSIISLWCKKVGERISYICDYFEYHIWKVRQTMNYIIYNAAKANAYGLINRI